MAAVQAGENERIPVHILTGFLGSGKTTLLRHLLDDPALHDTAVVINEFGEVGLDHLLVRQVAEDVVLLGSGCLCCTVRDDLVSTLANLRGLAAEGEIPGFARLAIETTGLADPAPIAQAVLSEGRLTPYYRLGWVVTTVDAVAGAATLAAHRTASVQVAMADRIVITKADMVEHTDLDPLERRIEALNGSAERLRSCFGAVPSAGELFAPDADERAMRIPPTSRLRTPVAPEQGHAAPAGRHDHDIATFSVAFDQPVRWPDFVDWLELLLTARGDSILRVKGLLAVEGEDGPWVVQGVQHVVYPAETLESWPDRPGRSWLVFIARDLTQSAIERSLREFLGLTPVPAGGPALA